CRQPTLNLRMSRESENILHPNETQERHGRGKLSGGLQTLHRYEPDQPSEQSTAKQSCDQPDGKCRCKVKGRIPPADLLDYEGHECRCDIYSRHQVQENPQ